MKVRPDAAWMLYGALVLPLPCGAGSGCGAEPYCPGSGWFAVEAGASAQTLHVDGLRQRSDNFALAFRGGLVLSPRLLLGLELGGLLIEAANLNDPSRGRGISQLLAVAQWQARRDRDGPWFKLGAGPARLWGLHPGDRSRSGWAASIAVGRDAFTTPYGTFGPLLSLTSGHLDGLRYRAATLSLNWSID